MTLIHLEWGQHGVREPGPACTILIIVDVLSFSTAVDVAVARGASVVPLPLGAAAPPGSVIAGRRGSGSWSLSPASLLDLPAGTLLALHSPNGATLSAASSPDLHVMAACLRNAPSVAAHVLSLARAGGSLDRAGGSLDEAGGGPDQGAAIGVIPAGERWPDGSLRVAVEDLLGAGAVIAALQEQASGLAFSPEALAAADAFATTRRRGLAAAIAGCMSGRELAELGFAADVELAAAYGVSDAVPMLHGGVYRTAREDRCHVP